VARRAVGWLVGAVVVAAVSCSGDDGGARPSTSAADVASTPAGTSAPQALTAQQAELLATMRLANYRAVEASFVTSVSEQASTVTLHGIVNWQQHTGSAVFRTAGRRDAVGNGLMQWNFDKVAAHPGGDVDGPPPPPPADGTWQQRPIDPSRSALDAVFLLLLSVASPDPDNPQLLRQTDAAYLGTEIVGGRTTTVFTGPSSDAATAAEPSSPTVPATSTAPAGGGSVPRLTYLVAADGALVRLRAVVGSQTVTVEFSPPPPTPTEYLPDLVTAS
jgi:hypothetical protein